MKTNRREWAKRVERWKASGLSAREFGAATGVSAKALQNWKWRLGQGSKLRTDATKRELGFVEVVGPLVARFGENQTGPSSADLELLLSRGVRVRVSIGFDPKLLRQVVETLEGR